jgi:hypothetical protein
VSDERRGFALIIPAKTAKTRDGKLKKDGIDHSGKELQNMEF